MSPVELGLGVAVLVLAGSLARLHLVYRRAGRRAAAAQERFRALFAAGHEGIVVHDSGRVLDANPAFERMVGHSVAELRRMSLEQLAPEGLRAQVRERLRTHAELRGEFTGLRRDGSTFPAMLQARDDPQAGRNARVVAVRDVTEERLAQAALRESEERFRSHFESSPAGLYRVTADGRVLMANPAFARMLGLPEDSYQAGTDLRRLPGAEAVVEQLLRLSRACGPDGGIAEREWCLTDGSRADLRLRGRVKEDDDGSIAYLEGSIEDLTAWRKVEEALETSEGRLRSVIAASSDATIIADSGGAIVAWNDKAETTFGYTADEAIGKPVSLVVPERYREACLTGISRATTDVSGGLLARTIEMSALRKDGSEFPCELSLSMGRFAGTTVLATSVRDITERVRADGALRASEERYRLLFNSSDDAIFLHGFESDGTPGRFIEVNEAMCTRLGYSREELLMMRGSDIRPPETAGQAAEVSARLHSEGHVLWETVHVARNGSRIPVEVNAHRFEADGQTLVLGSARDVSERKRLEQQLLQAQRMETVGRLAGGIAHDFNNLLTAISGHASFALEDSPADSRAREDIEQVLQAAERAAGLTQQLLAFSRRQVIRPEVLSLNDLLLDMDRLLHRLAGDGVTVVTVAPPDTGLVRADAGQMHQVITNLVLNARDAMPNGGRLTIETANVALDDCYARGHTGAQAGEYVMLSVSDTGVGMPPDVRERLFEPFFSTKGLGKGTGLGLASVYGVVKQHQGNIWVYSEPGQGTSFKVYLPRVREEEQPLQRIEAAVLPTGDETVLVAEDEATVRAVVVRVLTQLGYKVIEAANGIQALSLAQDHPDIDLVLTDMIMPEMGGRELAACLREILPGVKVLYVSGYTDASTARRELMGQDVRFLQKPFSARDLAGKVRAALEG